MTSRPATVLEITRLRMPQVGALADMLAAVEHAGESSHFHPHPFTRPYLETLCEASRRDLHYVLNADASVIGYGILRGWDEGYATPSLGIATHPGQRRRGHGAMLMHFLHAAAAVRGAERVRLRVHGANAIAIALYRALGYRFEPAADADGLWVAHKALQS